MKERNLITCQFHCLPTSFKAMSAIHSSLKTCFAVNGWTGEVNKPEERLKFKHNQLLFKHKSFQPGPLFPCNLFLVYDQSRMLSTPSRINKPALRCSEDFVGFLKAYAAWASPDRYRASKQGLCDPLLAEMENFSNNKRPLPCKQRCSWRCFGRIDFCKKPHDPLWSRARSTKTGNYKVWRKLMPKTVGTESLSEHTHTCTKTKDDTRLAMKSVAHSVGRRWFGDTQLILRNSI